MPIATMTSKGQTTIPRAVREHLNLKPGDKVTYTLKNDEVVMRAKNLHPSVLRTILPPPERTLALEDIDEAIAEAARERDDRSRY